MESVKVSPEVSNRAKLPANRNFFKVWRDRDSGGTVWKQTGLTHETLT